MQLGLNGRTALITGGSRGIGFGAARILAAEGCHLHWRELTKGFPFGRLGTVDEVVNMIAFLCSDLSSYTTGTVITIDGGATGRT